MQLITSEKPNVRAAVVVALGARGKRDRYVEDNGLIVSWCIGHLVGPADAGSYDERFKKWRYDNPPILLDKWQHVLSPGKEEQLTVLKNLTERSSIPEIVNAYDAGHEGELTFQLVYEMAGYTKPISRLRIPSMEDIAIREDFGNLKSSIEYETLYQSALCRSEAGWPIGMNAIRIFSVLYHKALNVGRAQTPTLVMLMERDGKISGFQKEKYYLVRIKLDRLGASGERIFNLQETQKIQTTCHERQAACVSLDKKKKTVRPPKLFDPTTLQREVNRIHGYTAKRALDYAQSLYEKKLITYPRTDSWYLTSSMADTAADVLELAAGLPLFIGYPDFSPDVVVLISDKDVSDHHAIIPTMETGKVNLIALLAGECSFFFLIRCKLLCGAVSPHVYEAVTAVSEYSGYRFTANGERVLMEGRKTFERLFCASLKEKPEDDTGDESDLPELAQGKTFERAAAFIAEHYTTSPKPYTEDTLFSVMEHAGKDDIPEDAERKGLGTPATGAAIIEKLVSSGFTERKGKGLVSTKDDINLVTVLLEALTSSFLIAEWEKSLSEVVRSVADQWTLTEDIQKMATEFVNPYSHISGDGQKLFASQREPVGLCPRCGEQVYEGKRSSYRGNRGCGSVLWKNDRFWLFRKKELTKKMAADLLKKGRVKVKGMYSEKEDTTHDATVVLNDTGGKYINFELKFEKKEERANER